MMKHFILKTFKVIKNKLGTETGAFLKKSDITHPYVSQAYTCTVLFTAMVEGRWF